MPYKVKGKCVYKKDTGKKVGCTDGPIKDYLAALHANADESEETTKDQLKDAIRSVLEQMDPNWRDVDQEAWERMQEPPTAPGIDIHSMMQRQKQIDEERERLVDIMVRLLNSQQKFKIFLEMAKLNEPQTRDDLWVTMFTIAEIGTKLNEGELKRVINLAMQDEKLEPLIQRLYGEETN